MTGILQEIGSNLYEGNHEMVATLVEQALSQGLPAGEILHDGLIAGMDEVGRDFRSGELFTPEVLITARAMHAGLDVLRPALSRGGVPSVGRFIIGTVKGDLHDIGKNLVKMMMEGAGFEPVDLGADVTHQAFVEAVRQYQPHIVGMSALLTTTMPNMRSTIEALEEAGLRDSVKIVVGGAPVTAQFADDIGADAYASDAATVVEMARGLVG